MKTNLSFEEFASFIKEETGAFDVEIFKETLIEDDLGTTGSEASDLIQKYSRLFGVDITNFVFEKYFYHEPNWLFDDSKSRLPITIGNLYTGITQGKLDDSVIQAS
nr:DUF1493 family protein [uncultured Mucilaginibacter sp.]